MCIRVLLPAFKRRKDAWCGAIARNLRDMEATIHCQNKVLQPAWNPGGLHGGPSMHASEAGSNRIAQSIPTPMKNSDGLHLDVKSQSASQVVCRAQCWACIFRQLDHQPNSTD